MIKTAIKYLKRTLMLIATLVIGYFIVAVILSIISTNPKNTACEQPNQIFVSTNGVHLDIIISKEDLPENFQQQLALKSYTQFVSFGWGDKGFFLETPTWNDLKLSTAINAMFLNSKTAMHVTNYSRKIKGWHTVPICDSQLELLTQYISNSFTKGKEGGILQIPNAGYSNNDEFYEANGNYNMINTCNNWVNRALKTANIKTSIWSPFDKGVIYHLEKLEE